MKKHIKAVDARGRKLGGETPLLCTPLVGRTRERVLAEAASVLRQKPDLVEWRVDFFDAIGDTGAVIETARALRGVVGKRPVIFTRRAERGGGERTAIGDAAVVELYDAVAASGLVDFIDFETDNDPEHLRRVRESTRRHEVRLILSYHNLSYTPGLDYLVDRFLEAERLGADVAMVQVMPREPCRRAAAARGNRRGRRQGAHSADQHVGGAARVGVADGRRPVRLVVELRRRRVGIGAGADPDRRPRDGLRHHPPLPRRGNVLTLSPPPPRTRSTRIP